MVGWHHRLNGHEFEQAPGVGDGQGGLACCSPWGHKESDRTERLNSNLLDGRQGSRQMDVDAAGRSCSISSGICLWPAPSISFSALVVCLAFVL